MNLTRNNQQRRMIQKGLTFPEPNTSLPPTNIFNQTSGSQTNFSNVQINVATIGTLTAGNIQALTNITSPGANLAYLEINKSDTPLGSVISNTAGTLVIKGITGNSITIDTSGQVIFGETITANSIATFTQNLVASGNLLTNNIQLNNTSAPLTINTGAQNLIISGNIINNNNVTINGILNIDNISSPSLILNISNNTSITGTLNVSAATNTKTLSTTSTATIGTNLTVNNDAFVNGTLYLTDMFAGGLLTITGSVNIIGSLFVDNFIDADTLLVTTDVVVGNNISTNNINAYGTVYTDTISPIINTFIATTSDLHVPNLEATSNIKTSTLNVTSNATVSGNITSSGNIIGNNIISSTGNINITPASTFVTAIPNIKYATTTLTGNPININATNIKSTQIFVLGPFVTVGTQIVNLIPDASCDGVEIIVHNHNNLAGTGTQINYPSSSINPVVGKAVKFVYINSVGVMIPFLST